MLLISALLQTIRLRFLLFLQVEDKSFSSKQAESSEIAIANFAYICFISLPSTYIVVSSAH